MANEVTVVVRSSDACACRPTSLARAGQGVELVGEVALAALAILLLVVGHTAQLLCRPLINLGHRLEDHSRLLRGED